MYLERIAVPAALLFLGLASGCAGPSEPGDDRPNIVILLADDAGYADLSCYGNRNIDTPNLDRIATEGARFTDFYAAGSNCSPSRTGLLTGRIPARAGLFNYISRESPMHLRTDETTIAELLRQAGYDTCVSGKWHLASDLSGDAFPQPDEHGFDHWFCTVFNAEPGHRNPANFLRNGEKLGEIEGYSCQIVVDEAIGWLDAREGDAPFFLYIPFHEPHVPLASPPAFVARQRGGTRKERAYRANVAHMDAAVGRLLTYLDETGAAENTLVVFFSDNGGASRESNFPLRDAKPSLWDGGIRVPGVMRWPGRIPPGTVVSEPAGAVDILPTIAAALGLDPPDDRPPDGTSLLPLFAGESFLRTTPLFWFFYRVDPAVVMRDGDWTLVGHLTPPDHEFSRGMLPVDMPYIRNARIERFQLFNVRNDVSQKRDRSDDQPERLDQMRRRMVELHREIIDQSPTWGYPTGAER